MSIITISRGSYYRGKEVAEKVARKLGFECISRDTMIEELDQFQITEIKLIRGLHDSPSVFDRFSYGKERYIANAGWALLKHFQKGNIIYHGLAGHIFLQGISHVLKVRIIADLETRVQEEMKRENVSAQEARYILKKDDEERRKWSLYLYGIDTWNPDQYDMVLNIGAITVDDAVNIIKTTIQLPCFQVTPNSQKNIDSLALAAQVQTSLFEYPTANVTAKEGRVVITIKAPMDQKQAIITHTKNIVKKIPGVKKVDVHFEPFL
jgi:cytidylate kinase